MKQRTFLAVGLHVLIMVLVLVPPLVLKSTGQLVYLETEKMDPRALIRGDYVVLGYAVGQGISESLTTLAQEQGKPVYVVITTDRPAQFVSASLARPMLNQGQACLKGRARGWDNAVDFPQIAQFFVSEGEGHALEQARGENLLAKVSVSKGCDAVLLGLEPR